MTTSESRSRPPAPISFAAIQVAALACLLLVAAGCADGGGGADGGSPPVLTVGQAAAVADGTEVQVRGVLIEDSGTLFVAEALAESYPPQPGGATIEVDGFDIATLDGLESAGPVRWLDRSTRLTGVMVGGRLTAVEAEPEDLDGG